MRPQLTRHRRCSISISIHAPTKGATQKQWRCYRCKEISIHAPTKGATCSGSVQSTGLKFQSTHPQRVRPFASALLATCVNFNPRTHKGCDVERTCKVNLPNIFQSTHPQRVRHVAAPFLLMFHVFQSTHPQRVRLIVTGLGFTIK